MKLQIKVEDGVLSQMLGLKLMVAEVLLRAVHWSLNGLKAKHLTRQQKLRIVRLQKNLRSLRLKYIVLS